MNGLFELSSAAQGALEEVSRESLVFSFTKNLPKQKNPVKNWALLKRCKEYYFIISFLLVVFVLLINCTKYTPFEKLLVLIVLM